MQVAHVAPQWGAAAPASPVVRCNAGCGEMYCSEACRDANWQHSHALMCVGPLPEDHPLVAFKYHAIEHCDTLLLAAQVFAHVALNGAPAKAEVERFCSAQFREVARTPPGRERDEDFLQWVDSVVMDGFNLLKEAWASGQHQNPANLPPSAFADLFHSPELLSKVLGIFELNNHDVEVPSPLEAFFTDRAKAVGATNDPAAAEEKAALEVVFRQKERLMRAFWGPSATGNFDMDESDDEMEDDEEMESEEEMAEDQGDGQCGMEEDDDLEGMGLEELLDSAWPAYHATALNQSVAKMNHSCEPNVKVTFSGSNKVVAVAQRPVKAGEELRISYIDEFADYEKRQKLIGEYLFTCNCPKCERKQ